MEGKKGSLLEHVIKGHRREQIWEIKFVDGGKCTYSFESSKKYQTEEADLKYILWRDVCVRVCVCVCVCVCEGTIF